MEDITLTTTRLTLRTKAPTHAAGLAAFFRRNEARLRPWDPPRPSGILEVPFWEAEAARAVADRRDGAVVRWLMFGPDAPDRVIGRINYTQIVRGPF